MRLILTLLVFLLVGCAQPVPLPTPVPAAQLPPVTATAVATVTPMATPATASTPTVTTRATATLPATAAPTATPDPYAPFTIEALTARSYGGGQLEIVDVLEETDSFARYLVKYPSDGLEIYGFMNVPHEGGNFPVALVLHGYIDPAAYDTLAYTRRYADALAEAGYFVIHPNMRGYAPSDEGPDEFRVGKAVDVLNLIAIIRAQSQDITGILRRANENDINLWGHSMGGGIALRVATINNADYVRTAVLYGSMSGDEVRNYEQIQVWSNGRSGSFELAAPPDKMKAISPINHLDRLNAAISIHHSEADDVVPFAWSEELCQLLREEAHPVECFTYYLQPHTFRGDADNLFMMRVREFMDRH